MYSPGAGHSAIKNFLVSLSLPLPSPVNATAYQLFNCSTKIRDQPPNCSTKNRDQVLKEPSAPCAESAQRTRHDALPLGNLRQRAARICSGALKRKCLHPVAGAPRQNLARQQLVCSAPPPLRTDRGQPHEDPRAVPRMRSSRRGQAQIGALKRVWGGSRPSPHSQQPSQPVHVRSASLTSAPSMRAAASAAASPLEPGVHPGPWSSLRQTRARAGLQRRRPSWRPPPPWSRSGP